MHSWVYTASAFPSWNILLALSRVKGQEVYKYKDMRGSKKNNNQVVQQTILQAASSSSWAHRLKPTQYYSLMLLLQVSCVRLLLLSPGTEERYLWISSPKGKKSAASKVLSEIEIKKTTIGLSICGLIYWKCKKHKSRNHILENDKWFTVSKCKL